MENKFYDSRLSQEINESFQKNVVTSERMYKEYVERYPKDYSMRSRYANNLIVLGKFDKAKTMLEEIERDYTSDEYYMEKKKNKSILKNGLIVNKLKLLIYTKQYEDAYNLLLIEQGTLRKVLGDYLGIKLFLQKKLGIPYPEEIPNYFLYNQIIDYDYEGFIGVTKRCHSYEDHHEGKSYFVSDFPLREIVDEIRLLIPNNNRLYNGMIDNHYYFKYNKCGYDNERLTDYFSLATYDDSNDFIAMYPIEEKEKYPYIDINYLRMDDIPPHKRVRRVSQMDKFNQKYKNMV